MAELQAVLAQMWFRAAVVAGVVLLLALVGAGWVAWRSRRGRESAGRLRLLADQTVELPQIAGRHRRHRRPVARPRPRLEERPTVTIRIYDPPRVREGDRR